LDYCGQILRIGWIDYDSSNAVFSVACSADLAEGDPMTPGNPEQEAREQWARNIHAFMGGAFVGLLLVAADIAFCIWISM